MKKILPLLLALLMLAGCSPKYTYTQISMEEAIVMMEENSDYILLDVRTPEEFAELHIPGAICIPNETIGTEEIPQLPDKDQLILVYCRSGNRSKQASEKLAALGYSNVYEFGGIIDWPGETVSGS
ncbi:MAG: rhodanese-like domain-containing protein [Clostridia bacterium]|nr:rhodanese-like domain-containing protein [Clostridia bacterium]